MNNDIPVVIESAKPDFLELNQATGNLLNFSKECMFAKQQLNKNSYTLGIAINNPNSLKGAIMNVAAVGLSLNPATQHAYLVPRDKAICLDISYRGLVKLATDTGVIKWARADIVYKNDAFDYNGPAREPDHRVKDVFGVRGEFMECYCIAKTKDGDILTEIMSNEEVLKVRDTSMAFTRASVGKKGPWESWPEEMIKKTIIKRASKTWPQSSGKDRLDTAVDVLNQHEGIEIDNQISFYTEDQYTEFHRLIKDGDAIAFYAFRRSLDIEEWVAMLGAYKNTAPRGQKQAFAAIVNDLLAQGEIELKDTAEIIENHIQANQIDAAVEAWSELSSNEQRAVLEQIDSYDVLTVNEDSK